MAFIYNWVEDKVAGYAKTGIQAGGTLAGNAVGGVGSLVEGAGRSAANTVSGSIGGVANYINGYGDSIKRSMSADGPVSTANKKTAVKPSGPAPSAQKALPSSQGVKKPLPAPGSAPKALPAAGAAPKALPKAGGAPKALPAAPKPAAPKGPTANAAKPPVSGAARSATGLASKPPTANSRTAAKPPQLTSQKAPSGKVTISPQSRPKPGGARTAAKPANGPTPTKDILGIGDNYSKLSSTRPQAGGQKGPASTQRRATAADPLAIGEDIASIGKKK